ncbi:TPA: hypothetical protein DCE37_04720 [Candidatus Latescibacteria bacterium]|nr:hypothetical protein [Candidatus Latescibacterota bacterium]
MNSPAKRAYTSGFAHRTWTRASSFYFLLMGSSPVKLKHDYAKFEAAGVNFQSEDETVCCYALRDKFWVSDLDWNAWEVFVVLDDADAFSEETSTCCQTEDTAEACC